MVYYVVILFPTVLPHSRLGRAGEKTISGSYYVLSVFYLTTATYTTTAAEKKCPLLGAFVKLSTEQLNTSVRLLDAIGDRKKTKEK